MKERLEMLLSYMKTNVAPILIDFMTASDLEDTVIIPANIDAKELNGHYEGNNYIPPKWFKEIINKSVNKILVIDKIDTISKEEQLKFCELLEYRKISTFDLPEDCVIVITVNEVNKDKINEEIFSLVARI